MRKYYLIHIVFSLLTTVSPLSTFAQTDYWVFSGLPGIPIKQIGISADEYFFVASDSSVFFSSDRGITWEERNNGLPQSKIISLLIDSVSSVSPRVLLIVKDSGLIYYVYETLNNGQSWEPFEVPVDFSPKWMGINSSGQLYFYDQPELIKTTDNGASWTSRESYYSGKQVRLKFLDFDFLVGDIYYYFEPGVEYIYVIKSSNDGEDWNSFGSFPLYSGWGNLTPGLNGDIFYWVAGGIFGGSTILRVRLEYPPVWYSGKKFNAVVVNNYDYIFFANGSQILFQNDFFFTPDNGLSWVFLNGLTPIINALDITKFGYLIAGTDSGVYISNQSTIPRHYPSFLQFGEVKLGEQMAKTLSIINNTTSEVTLDSLYFSSTIFSSPSLTPITLNPFDSTFVIINFSPETLGEFTEQVWVHTQDYTDSVSLFGSCPFPELKIFPSNNVHMGTQHVGTTTIKNIQLKNISVNTLQIDSLRLYTDQFDFNSSSFPIVLEEGEHSPVDIIFSPTVIGLHKDTLIIYTNGIGETEVYLIGSAINSTSIGETENEIPENFFLFQNYPNPFNPITKIKYAIPEESNVIINVYDILGKEIEILYEGVKSAGYYEIDFDASKNDSGVYFYRLRTGGFVETKKMILLR